VKVDGGFVLGRVLMKRTDPFWTYPTKRYDAPALSNCLKPKTESAASEPSVASGPGFHFSEGLNALKVPCHHSLLFLPVARKSMTYRGALTPIFLN
jgi:hypothetical protein